MVEFFRVALAGIRIEIECHNRFVFRQCKDYLYDFDSSDLFVTTDFSEIEDEAAHFEMIDESYEGVATTRSYGQSESIIIQRKIAEGLIQFDTILMHGSIVSRNGLAYMFTAPSGIGKTTRTKLWLKEYPDSIVINGDKPLIKVTSGGVFACGTPWCGKEGWNTNTIVPLRAIFLLERADNNETNSVERITINDALPFLLRQTYKPQSIKKLQKTLNLLNEIGNKVAIYQFHSAPTLEAVRLAYETAR